MVSPSSHGTCAASLLTVELFLFSVRNATFHLFFLIKKGGGALTYPQTIISFPPRLFFPIRVEAPLFSQRPRCHLIPSVVRRSFFSSFGTACSLCWSARAVRRADRRPRQSVFFFSSDSTNKPRLYWEFKQFLSSWV